jgi:DHA2 family multidrug resistance protein-like MFS transporter
MNTTSSSSRWWALGAMSLGLLAVGLDTTVLSLALPTLSHALGASESQLQWFVTSYTVALTAAMLPAGLLGDRYGRKRVLVAALLLFAAASIACAEATGPLLFVLARAALGVAGAGMIVMALALITVLFTPAERPRAIGVWGAANFLALPVGPLLGGWMLAHVWWGWVFLLNVPVVVVGLVAVVALVPESRAEVRPDVDVLGLLMSCVGLTALMYGVIEAGRTSWGASGAWLPLVAGAGLLAALVWWERRTVAAGRTPLIDMSLFRVPSFSAGVGLAAVGVFGLFGLLFLLPQYWQAVLEADVQGAGLRLLPVIAGMVVGAIGADRAAVRWGARGTTVVGLVLLTVAMVGASQAVSSGPEWHLGAWTALAGAGAGLVLATCASAALVELDERSSGVGAALVQAVVKLGPALGAAVLGTLLVSRYQSSIPAVGLDAQTVEAARSSVFAGLAVAQAAGSSELAAAVRAAFVSGLQLALLATAVAVAVGIPVAWRRLPHRRAHGRAEATQSPHEPVPSRD